MNSIKINLKGIKFKSYWKYENWKLKLKYGKENDSWSMIVVCWIVEKMNTYGMERDGGGRRKGEEGLFCEEEWVVEGREKWKRNKGN